MDDAEVSRLSRQMYLKHRRVLHSIIEDAQAS